MSGLAGDPALGRGGGKMKIRESWKAETAVRLALGSR